MLKTGDKPYVQQAGAMRGAGRSSGSTDSYTQLLRQQRPARPAATPEAKRFSGVELQASDVVAVFVCKFVPPCAAELTMQVL